MSPAVCSEFLNISAKCRDWSRLGKRVRLMKTWSCGLQHMDGVRRELVPEVEFSWEKHNVTESLKICI